MLWTMWTFARHRTTVNPFSGASALCTSGPFRFSRNPIYLGDWFILLGVSLLLTTFWPLLFAPLIWIMLRFGVIRYKRSPPRSEVRQRLAGLQSPGQALAVNVCTYLKETLHGCKNRN